MGEQLKVSQLSGLIDQIQAGSSSSGFKWIENVTLDKKTITDSAIFGTVYLDDDIKFNLTFTPKEDGLGIYFNNQVKFSPEINRGSSTTAGKLIKGIEYKATGSSNYGEFYVVIFKDPESGNLNQEIVEQTDSIIKLVF